MTDVKLRIDDLDALEEAAEKCGLELRRDQKHYAWWGRYVGDSHAYGEHRPAEMGTCAHALRLKGTTPRDGASGPWEIGVVPAKDGKGFGLYFDTYGDAGAQLTRAVEQNANKLRREYAAAVATKRAKKTLARKGFVVSREDLPGNRIRLKLRRR